MKRLTTMGPDGQPKIIGGAGFIKILERLYELENDAERCCETCARYGWGNACCCLCRRRTREDYWEARK